MFKSRLFIVLLTIVLAACASTPTPATVTVVCQPPEGWDNGGKFVQLRDSAGNVVGSLQLNLDEKSGIISLEGREPANFPPGSSGELTIGETVIKFFFDCNGDFWFPPGTIHVEPSS